MAGMVWLAIVIAGGVGLTLCDQMHVHAGVLSYPASDPRLAGQSWWVGLQFIAFAVLILLAASAVARVRPRPATGWNVVHAVAWFVGAYAATAVFWHHPRVLAILLGLSWLDRVALRPDRWPLIVFSVGVAVAGTLYEGALAGAGGFAYHHHDFFHVPFWLPGLYLHGALLAVAVVRYVAGRLSPAPEPAPLSTTAA
jgi:hypothetical protein